MSTRKNLVVLGFVFVFVFLKKCIFKYTELEVITCDWVKNTDVQLHGNVPVVLKFVQKTSQVTGCLGRDFYYNRNQKLGGFREPL